MTCYAAAAKKRRGHPDWTNGTAQLHTPDLRFVAQRGDEPAPAEEEEAKLALVQSVQASDLPNTMDTPPAHDVAVTTSNVLCSSLQTQPHTSSDSAIDAVTQDQLAPFVQRDNNVSPIAILCAEA